VLRGTAPLSPHDRPNGTGGNAFPVNKAAATAGVDVLSAQTWQLELVGPACTVHLSRPALMRMPQPTFDLPLSCVEGWSISRTWTGVPLADLLRLAGAGPRDRLLVGSLPRRARHQVGQQADRRTGADMIALFRRHYGASPLHLLALPASFALAGYAGAGDNGPLIDIGIWFVGAAIGCLGRATGRTRETVPHPIHASEA
jgi:hypothetical protein